MRTRLALAWLAIAASPVSADVLSADRMIWTRQGGVVDGPADFATLNTPIGLASAGGGDLYISDIGTQTIRFYDASRNRLETIAGGIEGGFAGDGGPYADARFNNPFSLATDARGVLYISDFGNLRIRVMNTTRKRITVATVSIAPGHIATIAGNGEETPFPALPADGPALETTMAFPRGLTVDADGNVFYCDIDGLVVRVIWNKGPKAGQVETYAGSGWPEDRSRIDYPGDHGDGGPARDMILAFPSAVAVGPDGDLYIAEWGSNRDAGVEVGVIWRVDHIDHTAHRVAGSGDFYLGGDGGPALDAGIGRNPQSIVFDDHRNMYIADNASIRRVDAATGIISTYAGRQDEFIPAYSSFDEGRPAAGTTLAECGGLVWHDGSLYYDDIQTGVVRRVDRNGRLRGVVRALAGLKQPFAAAIDSADRMFNTEWAHGRVRRVDPDGSVATAVNLLDVSGADDAGLALLARDGAGNGVTFDEEGNMFFTDATSSRVMEVIAEPGPGGRLIRPWSRIRKVAQFPATFDAILDHVTARNGRLYVGEFISDSVIEVDVDTGEQRTLAADLHGPTGGVIDEAGTTLYQASLGDRRIVAIDLDSGEVSPLADLPLESFMAPNMHLAMLGELLFVSNDYGTSQVWVIDTAALVPTAETYAGSYQSFLQVSAGDGGPARDAAIGISVGIAVDSAGKLLILERNTSKTRVVGTSDIRPGAFPNVIHAGSSARIDVAIESNPSLDATRLVPSSITVAGAATDGARLTDVNGDGRRDLVVRVRQNALARGLAAGAREAVITGRLRDGRAFADADWVTVAP